MKRNHALPIVAAICAITMAPLYGDASPEDPCDEVTEVMDCWWDEDTGGHTWENEMGQMSVDDWFGQSQNNNNSYIGACQVEITSPPFYHSHTNSWSLIGPQFGVSKTAPTLYCSSTWCSGSTYLHPQVVNPSAQANIDAVTAAGQRCSNNEPMGMEFLELTDPQDDLPYLVIVADTGGTNDDHWNPVWSATCSAQQGRFCPVDGCRYVTDYLHLINFVDPLQDNYENNYSFENAHTLNGGQQHKYWENKNITQSGANPNKPANWSDPAQTRYNYTVNFNPMLTVVNLAVPDQTYNVHADAVQDLRDKCENTMDSGTYDDGGSGGTYSGICSCAIRDTNNGFVFGDTLIDVPNF